MKVINKRLVESKVEFNFCRPNDHKFGPCTKMKKRRAKLLEQSLTPETTVPKDTQRVVIRPNLLSYNSTK